jgi:hypothetical protein
LDSKPRTLLIIGLLLAATSACSSFRASESKTGFLPEPKILHDKVSAIPSLDARVTKLVFFATGPSDIAPFKDRVYKSRFDHTATTRVHPEIHLEYPPPRKKIYFTVTVHIRENGRTFRIVDYPTRVEPGWTSSYHSVDIGVFGPGNWRVGTYEADVHINGDKVATASFEIY